MTATLDAGLQLHTARLHDLPAPSSERGDITITPARVISQYDLDRPGRHFCVHFYPGAGGSRGAVRVPLPLHLPMAGRVELARAKFRWIAYLLTRAARAQVTA